MQINSVFSLVCALMILAGRNASAQVTITEFLAANKKTLADSDGAFSDWVEIHNAGGATVNLNGWYLTDNANNLTKWRFPDATVPANGFILVWVSGKNRVVTGAPLHTSFSLAADGEYLGLILPDGQTVASQYAPTFPEQTDDISYGVLNGTNVFFAVPTPGAANNSSSIAWVAEPRFSHGRGFYTNAFSLTLTNATPGATIRYTTNGSAPSATNGTIYTGAFPIAKTAVIRAAGFKTGYNVSKAATHTFLFLSDVIHQSTNGLAPPGWPSAWGANRVDYGMDLKVVTNALYAGTIKDDLKSIPTISLVLKLGDLFDPATGIYANSPQTGPNWERPTSVELIYPDGTPGFQVGAGIRIRGGFSASSSYAKHSFRLFFRSEYGDSKLKYPLFGDNATDTFDGFDLATFQNHSWSNQGNPGTNALFFRDQFSRDTQLAMGHHAERGIYTHLYINGQYWGIYCPAERPEASYAESYFGGDKLDYDVVKHSGAPSYTNEATDGDIQAWLRLWQMATNGFSSDAAYQRVQGNNPDGSRNPAYEILLDVDNLIDYQLIAAYAGSYDGPVTSTGVSPNNWYGIRRRDGTMGFQFFVHDFEHSLLSINENRIGPYSAGIPNTGGGFPKSSPQYLWDRLQQNGNFRIHVADRVHRHFFNGGLLTPAACLARLSNRTNQVHRALVGESARWGDANRNPPYTRDGDWVPLVNRMVTNYFPQRSGIVLNQLKAKILYPGTVAPSFNQFGGNITNGFALSMAAPSGTIYYTLDGSDPRLPGGALSSTALVYSGPLALSENVHVKARVLTGATWSALNEAPFVIIRDFTELLVTEIMYHPPDDGEIDGDEFEFIELKNVANTNLDLSGVHFSNGIEFTFPNGTMIGAGEFVVLVRNPEAFAMKYPGKTFGGVYTGKLSNSGETLSLVHAAGAPIFSLIFSDAAPWATTPDGNGFSLVPQNPNLNPDPANSANWRASSQTGGSPGADDPTPLIAPILITEILTHTDLPQVDSVELFNPTGSAVDIGNWYLTDQRTQPFKYRILGGTIIPAGGYVGLNESDFNPSPGGSESFTFSSHGEEVYLYSADAAGNLTGYSCGFSFGAAENGVSFGRYETSQGDARYPAQITNTLGNSNSGPRVGPVVINEIRYRPLAGDGEFIELKNISGDSVKMFDPLFPANTWRLNGVGFTFPTNVLLPSGGLVVLTSIAPAEFRLRHNVPANVPIFGPYPGVLQDNGELLRLERPDKPDTNANNTVFVPYITVDEVRYGDQPPWPSYAGNTGASLERINATAYGNDPINWNSRLHTASPGSENNQNSRPFVDAGGDVNLVSSNFPVTLSLSGTVIDDGLPLSPGSVTMAWSQLSGPAPVILSTPHQTETTARFPTAGSYVLRLSANDGALQGSNTVSVVITRATYATTLVPAGSVWKFRDTGENLGNSWRALNFDDRTWGAGPAKFGYGDGNEATLINSGPSGAKYITTYFRHRFVIADRENLTALTVRLLRDDGAVVYLNDNEILRSNMPAGLITYTTLASSVVGGADETTFFESSIAPSFLENGTNIIAVELHQPNQTGTDAGFDFELAGLSYGTNRAPEVDAGADFSVRLPSSATLSGFGVDDGLPLFPGQLSFGWTAANGPGTVAFVNVNSEQTTAVFSVDGVYLLQLAASDGALNSAANVTVYVLPETYESWSGAAFSTNELANPNVSGRTADPDNDGFDNEKEFFAGTNPRDGQSFLRIEQVSMSPTGILLQFPVQPRRDYFVQVRDAIGGAWSTWTNFPPAAVARSMNLTAPNLNGERYYRLAVSAQPSF